MRITFLLCCIVSFGLISAQEIHDPRLLSHFSSEELTTMAEESPQVLDYWVYYLDKGFLLNTNVAEEPGKTFIAMDIPDQVNLLALDIFPKDQPQLFYDRSRKMMLTVLPSALIIKKFNAIKTDS